MPLWRDALNGAALGDFAPELGLAGAVTQVTLSAIPVIGDVCDVRDAIASIGRGDRVDVALNLLAMTPALGSVAKVAAVARRTRRVGQRLHIIGNPGRRSPTGRRAA